MSSIPPNDSSSPDRFSEMDAKHKAGTSTSPSGFTNTAEQKTTRAASKVDAAKQNPNEINILSKRITLIKKIMEAENNSGPLLLRAWNAFCVIFPWTDAAAHARKATENLENLQKGLEAFKGNNWTEVINIFKDQEDLPNEAQYMLIEAYNQLGTVVKLPYERFHDSYSPSEYTQNDNLEFNKLFIKQRVEQSDHNEERFRMLLIKMKGKEVLSGDEEYFFLREATIQVNKSNHFNEDIVAIISHRHKTFDKSKNRRLYYGLLEALKNKGTALLDYIDNDLRIYKRS